MLPGPLMEKSQTAPADPSVTILMACYDRLELLQQSVQSALDQRYSNFEVLIVDDGSGREVIDWLESLESREPRIRVIYQQHHGVAAARARGVDAAQTEWICILDSDDLLREDALRTLVDAMREHGAEIVFADICEVRANGEAAVQRYRQHDSTRSMMLATLLKPRLPFKHSGTLYRRQTAIEIGSYDTGLSCKIDVDLYLKFLRAGHLPVHVERVLVDFRMHKNSLSYDRFEGIRIWMYLIDRYGPANAFARVFIKSVRSGAELLKRVYIELRG